MDSHNSKLDITEVRISELENRTDSIHFLGYGRDRRDGKYKREVKQYREQSESIQYTSNQVLGGEKRETTGVFQSL